MEPEGVEPEGVEPEGAEPKTYRTKGTLNEMEGEPDGRTTRGEEN
jgi:hypothetical protein